MSDDELFTDEDRAAIVDLANTLAEEHEKEWLAAARAYRESVRRRSPHPPAITMRRIEELLRGGFNVFTDCEDYWEIWNEPDRLRPSTGRGYEVACSTYDNDLAFHFGITPSHWWLGAPMPCRTYLASMGDRFWAHVCRLNNYGSAFALQTHPDRIAKLSLRSAAAVTRLWNGLTAAPPPISFGVEWPIDTPWSAIVKPGTKALRMLVTLARRVDMREHPRGNPEPPPPLRLVK